MAALGGSGSMVARRSGYGKIARAGPTLLASLLHVSNRLPELSVPREDVPRQAVAFLGKPRPFARASVLADRETDPAGQTLAPSSLTRTRSSWVVPDRAHEGPCLASM